MLIVKRRNFNSKMAAVGDEGSQALGSAPAAPTSHLDFTTHPPGYARPYAQPHAYVGDSGLLFICCGGTIDKDYPRTTGGYAFEFNSEEPAVRRILERGTLHGWASIAIEVPFQKDSLEMTDADRAALVDLLEGAEQKHVVVTHGTDTMIETARAMDGAATALGKVVVVTGAMRPERFVNTDAHLNVGCAIGSVRLLGPGAWVCMGGVARHCDEVARSEQGEFVSITPFPDG
jgi:L-asparaginase